MIIENLHIDSFGRLRGFQLNLNPGLNILEGDNESGKSTVAAFIKFMFYGLPARERASAASWDNGRAAGSLTLNTGSRRFRIERSLQATTDGSGKTGWHESVQMVDLSNNMPCHKGESPGQLFFGVDADLFASTAFISQEGGTGIGGAKVSEGIENILFSADEAVNTQKALERLDAARILLLHKNEKGGRLFELDNECAHLEERLRSALAVNSDIQHKEAQLADIRKNRASAAEKADRFAAKAEQFEARTVLGLFDRMRALNKKVKELQAQLEPQSGEAESAEAESRRIREAIDQIRLLQTRKAEAEAKLSTLADPPPDPKLLEYEQLGGRERIEDARRMTESKRHNLLLFGIILAVLGGLTLAGGAVAVIFKTALGLPILVGGLLMLAAAVTFFLMRNRIPADDGFDIDSLEAKREHRDSIRRTRELTEAALADLERKLSQAGDPDALLKELEALTADNAARNAIRTEYDKYAALLAGMKEQLDGYSEEDLRARLDDSVDLSDVDAASLPGIRRERDFAQKMAASLEKHESELERALAGLYPTAENPAKLDDRLGSLKRERESLQKKLAAYRLASEKLAEASGNLRARVSPKLAASAAKLLGHITGGRYRELGVGEKMELNAPADGAMRPLESLSAGTRDAAYISLRIALIELLYLKCTPPMICDESFARLDDKRLRVILSLIGAWEQSLVFTSSSRDADRMAGKCTHIKMPTVE